MIPYIRQKKIIEALEEKEIIYIEEFLETFNDISESTLRRDLKVLEEEGQIILLRGGGVKLKINALELPVGTKKFLYKNEKEKIARLAASFVKNEEVVYIDSGTTCLSIPKYIKAKDIKIVTSNIQVLNELDNPNISDCIIVGGEVNKDLDSINGPLTDTILKNLFFDKAFVGTTGFGLREGINTPDFREASKKTIINSNSKKCYILADSSKYKKSSLCKAFELNQCSLITDKKIEELDGRVEYYVAE
ncbi:DeoR/GlpR family DNA-binding transcription regulator [Gracilibacillus sp. HCP3S3_G5_1]|uniref:DeoR/GlpR family DNA-binding transcription regulator n=1 Tax=unclassified Gracilibacillus TaxID=2625209 RepID=UPI003F8C8CA3